MTYHEPFVGGGALFFALRGCDLIVKWAGGKRQLLRQLLEHVRPEVFSPDSQFQAVLRDKCEPLIHCYRAIQSAPEAVVEVHRGLRHRYNAADAVGKEALFYEIRAEFSTAFHLAAVMAADFLFLNRAGYNGLWRVNKSGRCNTPWGKVAIIPDLSPRIRAVSVALADTRLEVGDFMDGPLPGPGDLVYLDPPYPKESIAGQTGYTAYTADGFTWEDHERLAAYARRAAKAGATVIVSNSDLPRVRDLYAGFAIQTVQARRAVNRDAMGRGPVGELIMTAQASQRVKSPDGP